MRQIRITKRRHRPDSWRLAPLPHDARDPDIVRAHEAARRPVRSRGVGGPDAAEPTARPPGGG